MKFYKDNEMDDRKPLLEEYKNLRHEDDDFDEEENKSFAKKIPLMVAIIVIIATLLTAIWYMRRAAKEYTTKEELPIVKADQEAVKVKPSDRGGMVVLNMDKTVYDNLSRGTNKENASKVEKILPSPEEPIDKVKIIQEQQVEQASEQKPAESLPEAARVPENNDERNSATTNVIPIESKPEQKTQVEQIQESNKEQKEALEKETIEEAKPKENEKPKRNKALTKIADKTSRVSDQDLQLPPKHKKKADNITNLASRKITSGYKVQLAAFKTEKEALQEWNRIKKKYKQVLSKYKPSIERREIDHKGIFYRLQAGPFASEAEARSICKKLTDNNQSCFLVKH
jgi:hypothetical protein